MGAADCVLIWLFGTEEGEAESASRRRWSTKLYPKNKKEFASEVGLVWGPVQGVAAQRYFPMKGTVSECPRKREPC